MNESHNFFKRTFHEFFMENHPDFVCSFPSRDEYNDWIDSYSSRAVEYWSELMDSDVSDAQAEEMAKDEFLKPYKFSPYHHFLSLFEENYPEIYENFNETSLNTFVFLSFFFFCKPVFGNYPSGEDFAYSDEMDNDILEILSDRLKHHKLIDNGQP